MKQQTNILVPLPEEELPDAYTAKALYEDTYDGKLQFENEFGTDLLAGHENLMALRQREFENRYPLSQVFGECANERPQMFQEAVLFFIETTSRLFPETL